MWKSSSEKGGSVCHGARRVAGATLEQTVPFSFLMTILDRYRGALLGLAAGDALGTTLDGARSSHTSMSSSGSRVSCTQPQDGAATQAPRPSETIATGKRCDAVALTHASVIHGQAHASRVEGRYDHARCRLRQREQIAVWHSRPHRAQTLAHRMIFLMACTSDAPHMMVVGPAS